MSPILLDLSLQPFLPERGADSLTRSRRAAASYAVDSALRERRDERRAARAPHPRGRWIRRALRLRPA